MWSRETCSNIENAGDQGSVLVYVPLTDPGCPVGRFLKSKLLEGSCCSTSASLRSRPSTPLVLEVALAVLPPDCFLWEGQAPSPSPHHLITLQMDPKQAHVKASSQLMGGPRETYIVEQIEEKMERQKKGRVKRSILKTLDRKWWTTMSSFMRQKAQMKQLWSMLPMCMALLWGADRWTMWW